MGALEISKDLKWSELLKRAVDEPGRMLEAYRAFHHYSTGNQLLVLFQCLDRGLKIGPISTYVGWTKKGRQVKKGAKALALCRPITVTDRDAAAEDGEERRRTFFTIRKGWFVLDQTDGEDVQEALEHPQWDRAAALERLVIKLVPFTSLNGNAQGFASENREISINPCAQLPMKTLFHELGHVMLGHVEEAHEEDQTPKNLMEVEAESVALLCLASLGLPGEEYCRGYIQHWLGQGNEIPETSAKRIVSAADKILKAGGPDGGAEPEIH